MAPLTVAIAGILIIVSTISLTGIGYRLALGLVDIAGGNIVILLLLVMAASILLGMGMPTVAAYIVTITLVAPALVEVGFQPITAHFFVFYFAMIASITPPIALVPAVTSKIADADFTQVAIESIKLGAPLFVLPFAFAFNESILVLDGVSSIIAFFSTFTGLLLLVLAIHYRMPEWARLSRIQVTVARPVIAIFGLLIVFGPYLLL